MADAIVEHPTYMRHIRHFFDDIDLEHMLDYGLDITTYPALKSAAIRVNNHTKPPNADMPKGDPARLWSQERSTTFRNWILDGCPLGEPDPQPVVAGTGDRVRKDARDLSDEEIAQLGKAFQGLVDRPAAPITNRPPQPDDGLFGWGSVHGLPMPFECVHHEDLFLPWHRPLLHGFEDALRSVPGCADVTLPYWDVTAAPPDFLSTAPFDAFEFQLPVTGWFAVGDRTRRYPAADIESNMGITGVPGHIAAASAMFDWESFRVELENGGHDNAHGSTGPTMSHPEVSSFDPIFWLFHANWDRLWWEWQQRMQATTRWSFRSTITDGDTEFLTEPFDMLTTFGVHSADTIDLSVTGVGYALVHTTPAAPEEFLVAPQVFGSLKASNRMRAGAQGTASVRLAGVDRMRIPGTFQVVLSADGEPVARQTFFQPMKPRECTGCREKAVVDIDMKVDVDAVLGRDLDVSIEVLGPTADRIGRRFPLTSAGDPTLNIRLPLEARA